MSSSKRFATAIAGSLCLLFGAGHEAAAQGKRQPRTMEELRDASLRFLLSKSTLVVTGEVQDEPEVGGMSPEIDESKTRVVMYDFRLKVTDVLSGASPKPGVIGVSVMRFEINEKDKTLALKKGDRCILFLDRHRLAGNDAFWEYPDGMRVPIWTTIDAWCAVHP